uniref:N-acetylaspartylglutamate synthase n=1 Tax=Latimeria chalumnae TaxID=7897 RepID=H3AQV9_LATCH
MLSSSLLWLLTDRRICEDYPQKEVHRALKSRCASPELDEEVRLRRVLMDEIVLTIEQGSLGLRKNLYLTPPLPGSVILRLVSFLVKEEREIVEIRIYTHVSCKSENRSVASLNKIQKTFDIQVFSTVCVILKMSCTYSGHENFGKMMNEVETLEFPLVVKNTRGHRGKAVFLARDKHHLLDLTHLIRHEAPYLFQHYVKESHGRDVRVVVVGGRVVGTMLRCSTDGRMQSNCSLGGVGMKYSLSEEGKQLAVQVSNILGMDVCGIDLLMKEDGSFYVCEANANVGFIAFDKACSIDVAGIIADYAFSLLPGQLTRRMSLLSVASSETSEPELGVAPAGVVAPDAVDSMSASSSSVDSDPETAIERELIGQLPDKLLNMNQLLASEI